jgi:hypothetical protein
MSYLVPRRHSASYHTIVLAVMPKKGKQRADIHLPGGALQTTFAVEGMAYDNI